MKKLILVTGNKGKAIAIQKILGFPIKIKNIDLEEIQDPDVEKITRHKVIEAFNIIKKPVIVDDVGLYVNYLNDFPGPFIKWVLKAGGGNASLLLKILKGKKNRKATARLAVGYHDGKRVHIFTGSAEGTIAEKIRGNSDFAFGWDSVFIPKGYKQTYAELSLEEKSKISHRRKALDKFKAYLDSQKGKTRI